MLLLSSKAAPLHFGRGFELAQFSNNAPELMSLQINKFSRKITLALTQDEHLFNTRKQPYCFLVQDDIPLNMLALHCQKWTYCSNAEHQRTIIGIEKCPKDETQRE